MRDVNGFYYQSTHTDYYLGKIDKVIECLDSKGLKAHRSRYAKYKGYINDFYEKGNPHNLSDLEQRFKLLNDAFQECVQIVQIFDAFQNELSEGFERRLKKAIYGADFYNPEQKSDQPRDFLYELLVASWFTELGYKIDFDQITDIVAIRNGITVYVECKRIKSVKGLKENFKKACQQLSKIEFDNNEFGLVFIDIYQCVADKIRDYEYSDILAMRKEVDEVLENNFRFPNKGLIEDVLTNNLEKTLAVAFTSVRCLWLSSVTPQFYQTYKITTSKKLSHDKESVLSKIFSTDI